MRKCIVLNNRDLTSSKKSVLDRFVFEYLRTLDAHCLQLPMALSSTYLHHLTYSGIRKTSFLPSDIVQEARKDIWKQGKYFEGNGFTEGTDFKQCSIRLNKRWFRFIKTERGNPCFKVTYSPKKTLVIPVQTDRQYERFNSFLNEGWVFDNVSVLSDGRISVVLEKEFEKPEIKHRYAVGIDIGSSTLAAVTVFDTHTSKVVRQVYFGKDVAKQQRRFIKRRDYLKSLADKGSHRAVQSLHRLKRNQRNFVKTRSGQIAKEIINLAKSYDAYISVEKLKNVRGKKGKFNRQANQKISKIPYGKLKEFLKSNCEMFQIPLHEVDAYHTSKWCSRCGAVNRGHTLKNYAIYKCGSCGQTVNSDRKASLAVAVKSVLERNKTRSLTSLSSIQISKARVPVNGLLRSDAVDDLRSVSHNYQPMECHVL
ncbi:MAG: IS200/IS605 family element transposase accessory protein TnpB [Candidatus Aenigmarchaeota archaeon]|nr:IS200/IS605 family element transposase accessory protein TnpB [Candidatus Aenigmarchaeota archaeon]